MQIQKAIQIFLQKNNLNKTLQIFKSESKKTTTHYGHSKTSQLSNIHKFTLNNTNANQVRQHFQKTDPVYLKKAIRRLKKNNRTGPNKSQINDLTKLHFFRRLVEKQNNNASNELQDSVVLDIRQSRSYVNPLQESRQYDNQWEGQNDVGYDIYECTSNQLSHYSQQISVHKNLQEKAIKAVSFPQDYYQKHNEKITKVLENLKDKKRSRLPVKTIFRHEQGQQIYPIQHEGITYDSYDLKIIYDREKTGFQQQRELPIVINQVLAARYQIVAVLGQAQFSKVIQVVDLQNNKNYCIKIIQNSKQENSKDYFDQSIDQIKLLRFIAANCNTDQAHLLTLHDFFYHKEHLMLVTQLLKDNLYDAYKMRPKFELKSIQTFSRQILKALQKMHSLHIIHTDLKPENILIKSYSKQQLKVIDIGSSIFFHDKLSFYIQTRSYRSPEVILGCPYDDKIDIWSFACTIAQVFTGQVLFDSETVGGLLAKMQGLRGPWPSWMIEQGKYSKKYFTKQAIPYEEVEQQQSKIRAIEVSEPRNHTCRIYVPRLTNLKSRLNCDDKLFLDFMSKCLKLDPSQRLSAKQALKHPFLNQ